MINEIPFEYWNKLAQQTITISSLLGGFSIAVIANFLVSGTKTRLNNKIMTAATLAACFFLITVFAMTKLMMMTTAGYPLKISSDDLMFPRIVGVAAFLFGIISLLSMIGMAGWTKSRKMGIFTTIIAILTFLFILMMTT